MQVKVFFLKPHSLNVVLKFYFKAIFILKLQLVNEILKFTLKLYIPTAVLRISPETAFSECSFKFYLRIEFTKYDCNKRRLV